MPQSSPLRLYGTESDKPVLEWAWVDDQLRQAGTYWVVARSPGHPHPRPVWGLWDTGQLHLSIGSPSTLRALALDPTLTVHLDSGTDVVILEGHAAGPCSDREVIAAYDKKYDWSYDIDEYGPLCRFEPAVVLAWRAAGFAGRESFKLTGRWEFSY